MLVLSRQRDEVVIHDLSKMTYEDFKAFQASGGLLKTTIVDIRGDKVRCGFEAPASIKVHRQEVFNAIKREELDNAAAANRAISKM